MKQSLRLWAILLGYVWGLGTPLFSQADTEFWFVAPEVAASHGDAPVLLGLSAGPQPTRVRLAFPADAAFAPLFFELAANELKIVDLSAHLNKLENKPANVLLDKGMLLTASSPINAYYHVNHRNNLDIFTLKGRQALGREFFIPSQNHFRNVHGEAAFDIVATEDNTTIEITPTAPIVGHAAGEPFTITLNRGQTFSCRATASNPASHLGGSRVRADKPIAITNSDDSIVNELGSGWDLVGDQLVPVKVLGTEYIAVRGLNASERIYITATADATEITLDGNAGQRVQLNMGENFYFPLRNATAHIVSSKPIYVWHLSGFSNENGAALLPPIGCTGLREANFIRPASENFSMILLTRRGNEDAFWLNGTTNIVPGYFSAVQGTNGEWVAARIDAPGTFTTTTNNMVNTKGLFHIGIIIHTGRGSAYGYFSNYTSLNLGEFRSFCEGDTLTLDGGFQNENFLWSTGSTSQQIGVTQSGTYWVHATFDGCELADTVEVDAIALEAELGPDTTICEYDSLSLSVAYPGAAYLWEDGSTQAARIIRQAGTYWVEVSKSGCRETDSLVVAQTILPPLDLGPDTLLCQGEQLLLNVAIPEGQYVWEDGFTQAERLIQQPGTYWLEREFRNCFQRDTLLVGRRLLNRSAGKDTLLCIGDTLLLNEAQNAASYLWEDGSRLPGRSITQRGIYQLEIANRCETFHKSWIVSFRDCGCELFVPNVFTPNGDGIHDRFRPQLSCTTPTYELQIYDRWGKLVFQSRSPADQWQGTYQGKPAPEGVYYWIIRYRSREGAADMQQFQKGYVTLMR